MRKKTLVLITFLAVIVFLFIYLKENRVFEKSIIEEINKEQEIAEEEFNFEQEETLREKILIVVEKANSGNKEGALIDYLQLLEEYSNDLVLLNNIAVIYSDLGQWEKSEEYYLKLINEYPQFIQGYRMLAYLYQYRFDDGGDKAVEFIEESLTKTDNHPDLIRWLVGYYEEIENEEMKNYYLEMVK